MKVFEAFVLLFVGLIFGVFVALFDIYTAAGAVMLLSRISVWILLNVFLAVHINDWKRAAWWAVPFNLGLVEMYYMCLSISYEGLARSAMVPLAGLAVVAPLLTIVAWSAKNEEGLFGKLLSALVVAVELVASVLISNGPSPLDFVVAVILVYVMFFMRPRKLVLVPSTADDVLGPDGTIDEGMKPTGGHERKGLPIDPLQAARKQREDMRRRAREAGAEAAPASRRAGKPKPTAADTRKRATESADTRRASTKRTGSGQRGQAPTQQRTVREPSRIARPTRREDASKQRPTRRTGGKTSASNTIRTRDSQGSRGHGGNGASPLGTSQRPRPSRRPSSRR